MSYVIIGSGVDGELLAIHKSDEVHDHKIFQTMQYRVCEELGNKWWWDNVSQAEWETYQAFGIKEVKL